MGIKFPLIIYSRKIKRNKMIIKRLKCEKCGFVKATNKLNDDRFYCPICGKNLGCYIIKEKKNETGRN